jgi:HlyD family type I secretion membrane fusion protein
MKLFKNNDLNDTTHAPVDDTARGSMLAGGVIIALFFGVAGIWAALAPLASAVVAPGVVKVEGNRKSIQHLEGGIVKELRIKEGDRVQAGQTLIVLDSTQALGAADVLQRQQDDLRAQEARLLAERDNLPAINFPQELLARTAEPDVATLLKSQTGLFESRRASVAGQVAVLQQKVAQTKEQIVGLQALLASRKQQLESIQNEVKGLRDLFQKGYVPRQRMLELERSAADFQGQVGDTTANIARARQTIAEATLQITQVQNERAAQVATDLRDIQARLLEVAPKLQVAKDTLKRNEIQAPYSGYVVGLSVFSVGGVIGRGEKLMDIVPDNGAIAIDASVNVDDIDDLRTDIPAEIRLTAYTERTTPIVMGRVTQFSADRLTDSKTGQGYYSVLVKINPGELEKYPKIRLTPGMPVTVMVPTSERTALDYLLKPLTDSMSRAMREK